MAGGEYADVCPVDREEDFLRAFSEGRELHGLRERVRSTDSQLGARRRELERLEKAVTKNAAVAVDETTTKEDRIAAVRDTAKLAEQIGKVKSEIGVLEKDLAHHRQELDAYLARQ